MPETISYFISENFPQIDCRSLWSPDHTDPSLSRLLSSIEVSQEAVFAEQVHGNNIRIAHNAGVIEGCDGIITAEPDLYLVIRTADCAGIMFFDPETNVIANVHAGWRGVEKGIINECILLMQDKYGSKSENLHVAVSPFIQVCCYEVGPEFRNNFSEQYLHQNNGQLFLNLRSVIQDQLLNAGIETDHLKISTECTFCSKRKLPSYRRTGTKNRIFNLIKRKRI